MWGGGVFFFNDTATTEIYTLSLHDALPISAAAAGVPNSELRTDIGKPAGLPHRGEGISNWRPPDPRDSRPPIAAVDRGVGLPNSGSAPITGIRAPGNLESRYGGIGLDPRSNINSSQPPNWRDSRGGDLTSREREILAVRERERARERERGSDPKTNQTRSLPHFDSRERPPVSRDSAPPRSGWGGVGISNPLSLPATTRGPADDRSRGSLPLSRDNTGPGSWGPPQAAGFGGTIPGPDRRGPGVDRFDPFKGTQPRGAIVRRY